MHSYAERCRFATTNQGLDPLVAALEAAGVTHEVAQTGGFCMAVVVPHGDAGNWAVVKDGDWLAGWFPANSWHDGEQDAVDHEVPELGDVVKLVSVPLA